MTTMGGTAPLTHAFCGETEGGLWKKGTSVPSLVSQEKEPALQCLKLGLNMIY